MARCCAEERKPVSYKLKKGELDAPDTPAGSPERESGEEPGSQDDSEDPIRQDASEGDSEAEQAPGATNGKIGTEVSHLPWRGQASVDDAATQMSKWDQKRAPPLCPEGSVGMQGSARQARARGDAQQDEDVGRAGAKRSRGATAEEQPSTPSKRSKAEPAPAAKRQVGRACHRDLTHQSCKRPGQNHLGGLGTPGCQHSEESITLLGLPRVAAPCVKLPHVRATSTLLP